MDLHPPYPLRKGDNDAVRPTNIHIGARRFIAVLYVVWIHFYLHLFANCKQYKKRIDRIFSAVVNLLQVIDAKTI